MQAGSSGPHSSIGQLPRIPTPSFSRIGNTGTSFRVPRDTWVLHFCSPLMTSTAALAALVWAHLYVPPMHSYNTDNVMSPTCFINGIATPNRMQEPPPVLDSTTPLILRCTESIEGAPMTYATSPDLFIFFLNVHLQTVLKDPTDQQPTAPVTIRRERGGCPRTYLASRLQSNQLLGLGGRPTPTNRLCEIGSTSISRNTA